MSLNEKERNVGYLLGRIFALLEKAQLDAAYPAKLNVTIKDRFFGTASASPAAIFPVLIKSAQHHIAAGQYGKLTEKKIEEVIVLVDKFPAHLTLDDQGMFMLGYYHQRNKWYEKKEDNKIQEEK